VYLTPALHGTLVCVLEIKVFHLKKYIKVEIMDLEELINNRYNYNFINNPRSDNIIKIIKCLTFRESALVFSIVMPIFNQESIITNNLDALLNFTGECDYEIILILDACSDNTEIKIMEWSETKNFEIYPLISKLTILKSEIPLFETAADNLGFFCAKGKYLLEIQADMEMTEPNYNMKLLTPFLQDNRIIGISGRCCHSFDQKSGVGKLGRDIELDLNKLNVDVDCYYLADTCNRGPLLLDSSKVYELGFLDEANFFLDNSDHDLFARSKAKGWLCGYCPIDFKSELKDGSTRKPRDPLNNRYFKINKLAKNGEKGILFYHQSYKQSNNKT
jgi:glycosyltransferase involved in cell wall biosynthesis